MVNAKLRLTVLDQIASKDKVRRRIIDAASALYARKGFRATAIQEIAEEAGVTLPVAYQYVKNKSEIMRMIMEDFLNIFQESLLPQIKGIEDPEEKLAIALVLYFRVVDQQREKALLIYQKSSSLDKASRSKIMQLEVDVSNIFGEIIKEGIQRGVFQEVDVDLMAYNILMMAHMWVLKRWHFKRRLTLDRYINLQLATIMRALRK
ncbi:MAG: TetR/AcrR family transcriptional regulator [Deltaproteobacteria bacterium]|nr:TetR/AcrR family transcriptional regulator [Deltaproteobacteria bacterium]MBW1927790.1 TetR/AcrR family transcriptional regulator [Deltaproteobacteria bacterium]MBW2024099.1 TetR/AcrR family transcriptional regulator [Deltaproteobacteria bacterium]MBW2124851.1 TetR/AcrR family transcriptional regulator [Deltaproteobacteria bacterium]